MSFVVPTYPELVRDLLTTLTGGTVREVHTFGGDRLVLLHRPPVKRVSHVAARWEDEDGTLQRRNYTEREVELIATPEAPDAFIGFKFRDGKQPPPAGATLEVNYRPTDTRPTPLTDVSVGSVVRTLMETVARELAGQYVQLERVYKSAFLETAEGRNLESVVALADVRRRREGHPLGRVRLSRNTAAPTSIFVPRGSVVTDGDAGRYLTTADATLRPNERSVLIAIEGETRGTAVVEAGLLTILERPIAGIDIVTNDQATFPASAAESDPQLRQRARRAFHQPGRGTRSALEYGLLSLDFVRSVSIDEFREGPGTVTVSAVLEPDSAENQRRLKAEVERLRPAGVQVAFGDASPFPVSFRVELTLAGAGLALSEEQDIQDRVDALLRDRVGSVAPGGTLRIRPLTAEILQDGRVVDVVLTATSGDAVLAAKVDLAADTPPTIVAIAFDPLAYEDAPSASERVTVRVVAELAVRVLDGDLPALRSQLEAVLGPYLAAVPTGALTFAQVADALRADDTFALYRDESQLSLEDDTGVFSTLSDDTNPYAVQARVDLVLADLVLTDVGA